MEAEGQVAQESANADTVNNGTVTEPAAAVKKARKARAPKVKKEPKPRKPAARMVAYIGTWYGSLETKNLNFVVDAECAPDKILEASKALPPAGYDTLTCRKGTVTVNEVKRISAVLG